jgi:hypothetical protein
VLNDRLIEFKACYIYRKKSKQRKQNNAWTGGNLSRDKIIPITECF